MAITIDSKSKEQMLRVAKVNNKIVTIQTLPETSADIVILEDTAGNFTSDNVEDALAEVMRVAKTGGVTGVKGDAEPTFRKGDVNITAENVGAEPKIEKKNTAFNKNFGTSADTVMVGNDSRVTTAVSDIAAIKEKNQSQDNEIADIKTKNTEQDTAIAGKANLKGGNTFTGDQSVNGSISTTGGLTVGGNLTVNGTTTTIDSTTLKVSDKLIEVAKDNTVKLTTPAGIVVPNYDGTNSSGALVFDGDGIASVGDVVLDASGNIDVARSQLQPLATRTGLVNDYLVKYDGTNQTLVDSGKKISDFATAAQGSNADSALAKATANATEIANIKNGTTKVKKAETADNATNATNVTTNINGKAITSIFESDGITAKNATHSVNADNATSARSADAVANKLKVSGQDSLGRGTKIEYDGAAAKEVAFNATDFTGTESSNKYNVELATVYLDDAHSETVEGTYTAIHVNSKGVVQTGGRSIAFIGANDDIPADVMIDGLVFRKKA